MEVWIGNKEMRIVENMCNEGSWLWEDEKSVVGGRWEMYEMKR